MCDMKSPQASDGRLDCEAVDGMRKEEAKGAKGSRLTCNDDNERAFIFMFLVIPGMWFLCIFSFPLMMMHCIGLEEDHVGEGELGPREGEHGMRRIGRAV